MHANNSYAQAKHISIDFKNITVIDLLNELKFRSDFQFFYKSDLFNGTARLDAKLENATLMEILDATIVPMGFTYSIDDKMVAIRKEDIKSESKLPTKKQQPGGITISGQVIDDFDNSPIPGVNVLIVGKNKGTVTDVNGIYSLLVEMGDSIMFSFVGYTAQTIRVGNERVVNVRLSTASQQLGEAVVVAFGKQKKESVISSISTINTKDLKVPSSNLTTALAGRMAGVISYQRSGEPGQDNAEFFVRGITSFGADAKKDPLILIDNVEMSSADLSRLNPDDIQSFSILKDATAAALYGARGANGVILVMTKEGREGKARFSVRFENSLSMPTQTIDMADPISYMNLYNEAIDTRGIQNLSRFTYLEIERRKDPNKNDLVYPTVDWNDMLTKSFTNNQRLNMNLSGGGKVARYYVAGSLTQDNGVLKVDNRNNFNTNIDLKKFLLRSNININVTKTTKLTVRMHGTFDDYRGPIDGGSAIYTQTLKTSPVLFPATFEKDEAHKYADHTFFGNKYEDGTIYQNPYANMVRGYKEYDRTMFMSQLELEQDLGFITKGLNFRMLGSTSRYSYYETQRQYDPFYYEVATYNRFTDVYSLFAINDSQADNGVSKGNENLRYVDDGGSKNINSTYYLESTLNYHRTFAEKHAVGATIVSTVREYSTANPSGTSSEDRLQASLPNRNLGVSGRLEYAYDSRYFAEFNFGYNGSERFDAKNRFGFFPAIGAGWLISNENFWNSMKQTVSTLKLKATYGLVGNDQIGNQNDRFFFLSSVSVADGANGSMTFGRNRGESLPLTSVSRYANPNITWEIAYKQNYGIELGLFDKVMIQADYFREKRTNILQARANIPESMGLEAIPQANVGQAEASGIDGSVDYQQSFTNGMWITARGNFTFARSKITVMEEPNYIESGAPWLSRVGYSGGQQWGYVAERLFVNDVEVANSAPQNVSTGNVVMGGDIKYKDINKDGVVDGYDMVPIGFPTTPEIIYGFGASMGWKGVDFSFFFQGSARSSFWVNYATMNPFVKSGGWITGLTQYVADNHWSEENPDVYAEWPRLSPNVIGNNNVRNTYFMQDGSFLRLKSMELGYSLPEHISQRANMSDVRLYLSGSNLLCFSKFKLWDVEMGGSGLGYPIQRVFNIGVQVSF
ncbi:MAG: SusC/RagA family TonB-linked outer membrane protein [Draconibacterium sp.]